MKNITQEIADSVKAWLESEEVQASIKATGESSDTGEFSVVITTENLDRYSEVIKLDGWELEHYMKNPVVLWGHDHFTLPVGVCTSIETVDGKMVAKGKFAPHEHAQQIRALYDLGIVRATSVGFIEKEREGNLITKAELIEFSFVSVPANPYALSTLVKSGISVNDMVTKGFMTIEVKDADETVLDEEVGGSGESGKVDEPVIEPVVEEKKFDTKAVKNVVAVLKDAVAALEALDTEVPEGGEVPEDADTEEQKQFKEFSEKRRVIQEASTVIGEVLAEARRAVEVQKK